MCHNFQTCIRVAYFVNYCFQILHESASTYYSLACIPYPPMMYGLYTACVCIQHSLGVLHLSWSLTVIFRVQHLACHLFWWAMCSIHFINTQERFPNRRERSLPQVSELHSLKSVLGQIKTLLRYDSTTCSIYTLSLSMFASNHMYLTHLSQSGVISL